MSVCKVCGEENPDRAKFCLNCASPLGAAEATEATEAEERKLVSVLFADLVGFTARSEEADPEDVRAILRPYHAALKREIERYGGTVEKFIGDAAMGVFGAPLAHEDDPERAVRAALRIQEAIAELKEATPGLALSVRAAVNTGEAVVALGARPELGEGFVAGDVVNTASRLQAIAPEGGVVVGEATYRATRDLVEYEPLEPVRVKGKAEPLEVWRARAARGRYGVDVRRASDTPLVGREDELELVKRTFARALREPSVQLVTVIGEPGVGKSRLVAEFFRHVDETSDIVYWRQGRCLPYGEGVTFWALGEVVKAHAGILESDSTEEASAKLDVAVQAMVEAGADRDWVRSRLAPLAGLSAEAGENVERAESFAAWRRFLEAVASRSPLVLVFEDLHWADAPLLEFVDHLVEYATGVPMLVLCTARPELYEGVAGWGGGKRNSTTISLAPLTEAETGRLVSALLPDAVLPGAVRRELLERAGGNPLYAEEFARMLTDAGLLVRDDDTVRLAEGASIPMPDTVQALIAARLDTVPAERKVLLHDASVVGKVFWSGALSVMAGLAEEAVRHGLHELGRKELVRPVRGSSVKDQDEYAFWHLLVRDVAYAQIPRAARAAKHRAAAAWIEGIAGERVADHAALLAYHYEQALELARASGESETLPELEARARRFLELAGDRAFGLDTSTADAFYGRALGLSAEEPDRAALLLKRAHTQYLLNRPAESERLSREAAEIRVGSGDRRGEAEALMQIFMSMRDRGRTADSRAVLARAVDLLEREPPGRELVRALGMQTRDRQMASEQPEALAFAERALALAAELGEEDLALTVLWRRGVSRYESGDPGGIEDIREALRRLLEKGMSPEAAFAYNGLGDAVWFEEGPERGIAVFEEGIAFSERRGLTFDAMWMRGSTVWPTYEAGRWDEAVRSAESLIREALATDATQVGIMGGDCLGLILAKRGDFAGAGAVTDEWLPRARVIEDPQMLIPALTGAALVAASRADRAGAAALLGEIADLSGAVAGNFASILKLEALRLAADLGDAELLAALHDMPVASPRRRALMDAGAEAIRLQFVGDPAASEAYAVGADAWGEYGNVVEQGEALGGQGRTLVGIGRGEDALTPLRAARDAFEALGARNRVAEIDGWIARAGGRPT